MRGGQPDASVQCHYYQRGVDFVMRAKVTWNTVVRDFVSSGLASQVLALKIGKNESVKGKLYDQHTQLAVRLVRVELPSGEIEVLISSLLDEGSYPSAIFKDLYRQRWGIETRFDVLKNALRMEHFSGICQTVITQDFYITLLVANLEALLREEVNQQIQHQYSQHQYQVNITVSASLLREKIGDLLLGKQPQKTLDYLTAVFAQNIEPVRPDRSFTRKADRYRTRNKPKKFKNRRSNL